MPPKPHLLPTTETTETERVVDRALDAVERSNKLQAESMARVETAIRDMQAAVTASIEASSARNTKALVTVLVLALVLFGARDFYFFKVELPGMSIQTGQGALPADGGNVTTSEDSTDAR